jgi:trehalose 6-phosphate phosphatase
MKPAPPVATPASAPALWLFLDYDGTLANFAPTPDDVFPEKEIIQRISNLAAMPATRVAVVSGRRLEHLQKLVPVKGVVLAGTYGLEIRWEDGTHENMLDYSQIRPVIARLRPEWEALLAGRQGFYLENKGWTLAVHARFANEIEAGQVFSRAREVVKKIWPGDGFVLQGGRKFLEIRPAAADKSLAVRVIWDRYPIPDALPVYLGDDDKDEVAFRAIEELGGMTVQVRDELPDSLARYRLASPREASHWLDELIEQRLARFAKAPGPQPAR